MDVGQSTRVVLSETDETIHDPVESQLIVTHASRSDVIESIIKNHKNMFISSKGSRVRLLLLVAPSLLMFESSGSARGFSAGRS